MIVTMAYDEDLANRIRELIASEDGYSEQKMFGGIGFMLNGNMCCGVHGDEMILRVGPEEGERALKQPNTRPFAMQGQRPMTGMVMVDKKAAEKDADFERWVGLAVKFTESLPAKKK